jgi:hypothetical protein
MTGRPNNTLPSPIASDPEPCLSCRNTAKCATGYACHRFMEWSITGRDKKELSRVPERGRYVRLFSEPKLGSPEAAYRADP